MKKLYYYPRIGKELSPDWEGTIPGLGNNPLELSPRWDITWG